MAPGLQISMRVRVTARYLSYPLETSTINTSIWTLRDRHGVCSARCQARSLVSVKTCFARPVRWTPEDDDLIKKLRSSGRSTHQIQDELPNRPLTSLRIRIALLTSTRERVRRAPSTSPGQWTEAEDALLLHRSKETPWVEILPQLPGRSYKSMLHRYKELLSRPAAERSSSRYRRWSPQEIERMIELRNVQDSAFSSIASILERTLSSVRNAYNARTAQMKSLYRGRSGGWTKEETATAIELRKEGNTCSVIAERLGTRTAQAVKDHL